MSSSYSHELYQQVILEHNRKPRNFKKLQTPTHFAEGYNPLCGDHLYVYLQLNKENIVEDISFEGQGCAISRASASMMTVSLKGKNLKEAENLFEQFRKLLIGQLKPDQDPHVLGKLGIFSGIWQYPSRVKCAALAWHTMNGALNKIQSVSTEA